MKLLYLIIVVVLCLLASPLYANPNAIDKSISQLLQLNKNLSLSQRIDSISASLLNVPYEFNPLGEGKDGAYDQKPLYRFDVFDCQTYVETILALALASSAADFENKLKNIRYRNGMVSFVNRNHFPNLDWIPNNHRNGYIKDITSTIAYKKTRISHVFINRQIWYQNLDVNRIYLRDAKEEARQQKLMELKKFNQSVENAFAAIDYVPINDLLKIPNEQLLIKIPTGSVVFLVVNDPKIEKSIHTPLNISHMGFAIWKNHSIYLRHASLNARRTVDVPLKHYLNIFKNLGTLLGISVWQPTTPPQSSFSQSK